MSTYYDFGPLYDVPIRLTGEVYERYGNYENLAGNIQEVLQLITHAVIQLADTIARSNAGVLWIEKHFMIMKLGSRYTINNFGNGMGVINLYEERKNCFSTDFFSIKQLALTDPILDYAYKDSIISGRNT